MKIIVLALVILAALQIICAQSSDDIQMMIQCIQEVDTSNPCKENDEACQMENFKAKECIKYCARINYLDELAQCIKNNCSSENQEIQNLIYETQYCLSTNIQNYFFSLFIISFLIILL
ncbi:hypothetical protein ABPG74_019850 [Tetrahymena malaccensis]